ncbi:hypothetical protein OWR28_04935 [Chryseobacterium sp. 1B4]
MSTKLYLRKNSGNVKISLRYRPDRQTNIVIATPSTLGSKSGLGRSKLYILNRMLAPYFRLDPMSFSGYLHLTSQMLEAAINDQKSFLRKISDKEYDTDTPKIIQLDLFDNLLYDETN